jgi:hypothetical protein
MFAHKDDFASKGRAQAADKIRLLGRIGDLYDYRTPPAVAEQAGRARKEARDVQRTAGASGDGNKELAGRASAHEFSSRGRASDSYR